MTYGDTIANEIRAESARQDTGPSVEELAAEATETADKLGALLSQLEDRLHPIRRPIDEDADAPTQKADLPVPSPGMAPLVGTLDRHIVQLRQLSSRINILTNALQL